MIAKILAKGAAADIVGYVMSSTTRNSLPPTLGE